MGLSDTEVYQLLQGNDTQALAVFYKRSGTAVYRLALRLLGNSQEAEDLTQEIFLNLWHKRNYDDRRGSMNNFLLTMTRSRALDRLRSRGSNLRFVQRFGLHEKDKVAPNPFEQTSAEDDAEHVTSALQQLPESQRQLLEMAYHQGLSQSEIASRIDVPLGTVKSRTRQALARLKSLLYKLVR